MTEPSDIRAGRPIPTGSSFELFAWFFMRVSGVLLLLLALGHLAVMHLINSIHTIDYDFVAERWSGDWGMFWRSYDWLLLSLALLHGSNGLRTILDDFIRPGGWRTFWMSVLYSATFIFLAVGSIIVFTFSPL
ncbi:MAG: succinate dehydrogenase [Elusimicrobia bacterium RIFCSPLOWO2_01_FULL_64_13]|nr:MAG: succinate dehydrogenase [Elusimicrobia bacterium RIFCSPLOWO2_01_FULL_64_13]